MICKSSFCQFACMAQHAILLKLDGGSFFIHLVIEGVEVGLQVL